MRTVMEMARESKIDVYGLGCPHDKFVQVLERFAALVAAEEREACAKVVEPDEEHRRDASWGYIGGEQGVELLDGRAAAIRARSNT
jgi:hypothetical protein